ncbi:hypothetical protein P261_00907 [Lachnospiraceae bacterium TWA4]|nr:hypothetical protein P261_00907 [Lachnospiraceae bacterium TWA4]
MESLSEKKMYQIKDGFILREIAGECMIIPSDPDSDIKNGMLVPNGSATLMWKVFQQPSTIEDVVKKAMEEYEVEEDIVKNSVQRFVSELLQYRILEEVK